MLDCTLYCHQIAIWGNIYIKNSSLHPFKIQRLKINIFTLKANDKTLGGCLSIKRECEASLPISHSIFCGAFTKLFYQLPQVLKTFSNIEQLLHSLCELHCGRKKSVYEKHTHKGGMFLHTVLSILHSFLTVGTHCI